MKICTNCGEKEPNERFIEQCGDTKIINVMCKECREKGCITPEQADKAIKSIGKRLFT